MCVCVCLCACGIIHFSVDIRNHYLCGVTGARDCQWVHLSPYMHSSPVGHKFRQMFPYKHSYFIRFFFFSRPFTEEPPDGVVFYGNLTTIHSSATHRLWIHKRVTKTCFKSPGLLLLLPLVPPKNKKQRENRRKKEH